MPLTKEQLAGEISKDYPISFETDAKRSPKAALSAPGQNIRQPGMFDEMMQYPAGEAIIKEGAALAKSEFGINLLELAAADTDPITLMQTDITQLAVGLWSLGFFGVHKYHGTEDEIEYQTIDGHYMGISMGKVIASVFAGFQTSKEGLLFLGERGKIMKRYRDPRPSSMISILESESFILKLLGQEKFEGIDLSLILSEGMYVLSGFDSEDPKKPDPQAPMQLLRQELKERKKRFFEVATDGAMHGRTVRPASPKHEEFVRSRKFRAPVSAYIGTLTGLPVKKPEDMQEELIFTFAHTDDNVKPYKFLNANEIHVFSEIHPKGDQVNIWERSYGAINANKGKIARETAKVVTEAVIIGGTLALKRVLTRHNPEHPENGSKR